MPPPYPELAIIITTEHWEVVTSIYLYEARPWLFAEFAIASEAFDARTAHSAGKLMIDAMVAMAAAKGLAPFAAPRVRGIELMLKNAGFKATGTQIWVANVPSVELTEDKPKVAINRTPDPAQAAVEEPGAQKKGDQADQSLDPPIVPPDAPKLKGGRVRRKGKK